MAEVSNVTFLIVSVTLTCFAALFVFGRLIANWVKKGSKNAARAHEVILLLSLAALGAAVAGYNHFILTLTDPTTSLVYLMKLSHALTWLGAFMLWGCKVPVLLLYISLFGIHRWLKITSYAVIIISGTIFVILTSFVTAKCRGPVDDDLLPRCTMATTRAGFTLGLVSVLTDLVIFTMPLPIILRLNLPLQKRIGVALVFASGLAGITASIISTHYKYEAMKWSTTSGTNAMICTIVECAVALIVACVPSLYGLWNQSIVESGIYSRISWRLSQVFSSSRSAHSQSRASGDSSSSINSKETYASESVKKSVSIHVVDEEAVSQPAQGR